MAESTDLNWVYINKMDTRGNDNFGSLLHFSVGDLHWELNYRGDAPLLIYHTEKGKHVLQIGEYLFNPTEVNLCDPGAEEEFYGYLFDMKTLLNFLNTFLFDDLELEYNEDEEDIDLEADYELSYEGENVKGFAEFQGKVSRGEKIFKANLKRLLILKMNQ